MSSLRRPATAGALSLVVAGAVLGLAPLTAAPAQAAACSSSSGVSVVVDFNDLGGGVASVCLADGAGKRASDLLPEAGYALTYAQREPGYVCRVHGVPTSDPCVNTSPADAYWGLWWSTGDPGAGWTYSSLGATSLTLPAGSIVAFAWDDVGGDAQPSAPSARPFTPSPSATSTPRPTASTAAPVPSRTPTPAQPTKAPPVAPPIAPPTSPTTSAPPGGTTTPTATPDPTAPTSTRTPRATPSTSSAPVAPPTTDAGAPTSPVTADATAGEPTDQDAVSSTPLWIVLAVLLVLLAAVLGVVVQRRRAARAADLP